jgi:hypothetical protein
MEQDCSKHVTVIALRGCVYVWVVCAWVCVDVGMRGFLWMCVCVGFVMCVCLGLCGCVGLCGFVWMCVCVGLCGCVDAWVL